MVGPFVQQRIDLGTGGPGGSAFRRVGVLPCGRVEKPLAPVGVRIGDGALDQRLVYVWTGLPLVADDDEGVGELAQWGGGTGQQRHQTQRQKQD
jgi:hypothetical protein